MYVILVTVVILVCCSIFVNGWTDAPNAIATVISTRVLNPRAAIVLGTVFNLLGVFLMGSAVATTTASIVTIGTGKDALVTLGAAQLSIIIWAVSAWRYGIPTSESHALIAGLMGAGISLNGINAFNWDSFKKVLIGLVISSVVGFGLGLFSTKSIEVLFKNVKRRSANKFFSRGQILSASLMAFSHGAQDGQKFMGVLYLALVIGGVYSNNASGNFDIPIWIMILCSLLMGVGTSVGGYRIIKTMGMDMVRLEKYQGFAAEVVASGSMIAATLFGIPLSTTNTKATAMMGAGASKGFNRVNWGIAKEMILAWILTFPVCMALGYVFATVFRMIL
ncbi:MAG TPA: inorganic phosphate transporter [Clostridiales bacterium]|nr:inorganic phosphate transporter [Clostridiales bacterium]